MASQRITIQLTGAVEDDGFVRFSEFIQQLESVKTALRNTERLVSSKDEATLQYRIVGLSLSSPATVIIEASPLKADEDFSTRTVKRFFTTLRLIQRKKRAPQDSDLAELEAYRSLATMLEKHITEITFVNSKRGVSLNEGFRQKVAEIIGPDELIEGSLDGTLEWLNIHNTNRFNIYPPIGPRKVICDFPGKLRQKVIPAIDKQVRVFGSLRYKKREDFPYAMNVSDVEILPPDDELPTLYDLHGIAPDATGNLSAERFIESLRDENK